MDSTVKEIGGDKKVEYVTTVNKFTNEETKHSVDGVFAVISAIAASIFVGSWNL